MKMRIENIPVKDYIYLSEVRRADYDFAIKYGYFDEQKDIFRVGELTKRNFGFVKDLQQLYEGADKGGVEFFNELNNILVDELDITLEGIYNTSVFEYFNFLKFMSDSVARVFKIERSLIVYDDGDSLKPDSKRFEKYGYMIQIDSLADGRVLDYDKVRELPYEIAFGKMMYEKDKVEYNNEYRENVKRKNKHHG
jgi:hypothetical protein